MRNVNRPLPGETFGPVPELATSGNAMGYSFDTI
jgi:hypothetical protein